MSRDEQPLKPIKLVQELVRLVYTQQELGYGRIRVRAIVGKASETLSASAKPRRPSLSYDAFLFNSFKIQRAFRAASLPN